MIFILWIAKVVETKNLKSHQIDLNYRCHPLLKLGPGLDEIFIILLYLQTLTFEQR